MELPYLQRGNIVYLLYVQVCNNKKSFKQIEYES